MKLSLVTYRSLEVVETFEDFLNFCSARGSDVRSAAIIVQMGPRDHRLALAGGYRRRPADAYGALQLLERKLRWDNALTEVK